MVGGEERLVDWSGEWSAPFGRPARRELVGADASAGEYVVAEVEEEVMGRVKLARRQLFLAGEEELPLTLDNPERMPASMRVGGVAGVSIPPAQPLPPPTGSVRSPVQLDA